MRRRSVEAARATPVTVALAQEGSRHPPLRDHGRARASWEWAADDKGRSYLATRVQPRRTQYAPATDLGLSSSCRLPQPGLRGGSGNQARDQRIPLSEALDEPLHEAALDRDVQRAHDR